MQLGKPALNDLKSGLATAPVLYAAEEHPELHALILRRFKCEGTAYSAVFFWKAYAASSLREQYDADYFQGPFSHPPVCLPCHAPAMWDAVLHLEHSL